MVIFPKPPCVPVITLPDPEILVKYGTLLRKLLLDAGKAAKAKGAEHRKRFIRPA